MSTMDSSRSKRKQNSNGLQLEHCTSYKQQLLHYIKYMLSEKKYMPLCTHKKNTSKRTPSTASTNMSLVALCYTL